MRNAFVRWLDDRTGLVQAWNAVVYEPLPGGARWRYVFGHALAATFVIQLLTGLLLMTAYVPSASQAWGSVWYIQTQMVMGWFVRGLHHFGSSAMMVLLVLHLMQGIGQGSYRPPREVNWWLGLGLMMVVLGLALTGYLLPWDQKGYWATRVATNIAGSTPVLGPSILKVIVGGTTYGNQTLTRLFGLHVGVLPMSLLALLVLHLIQYYRHGVTAPDNATPVEPAWPGQVFRNLVAVAIVLGIQVGLTLWSHGANLEAPADPTLSDYPARPEWYFLFLFQMLNHFKSPYEVIGTHILPTLLIGFLALLPVLGHFLPRRLVHGLALAVMAVVLIGVGFMTTEALLADRANETFQLNRQEADQQRERSWQLAAHQGVPADGGVYILRRDPWTHGRSVLDASCLSCHVYGGHGKASRLEFDLEPADLARVDTVPAIKALPEPAARAVATHYPGFEAEGPAVPAESQPGRFVVTGKTADGAKAELRVSADGQRLVATIESKQSASDLAGFGSREWIRGLLEDPSSPKYFGTSPQLTGMKSWKRRTELTSAELDDVADFVAALADVEDEETLDGWFERRYLGTLDQMPGNKLFIKDCGQCHVIGDPGLITDGGLREAPDLFGYGSRDWLERMINEPGSVVLYGFLPAEEQMPGFADQLTVNDLDTLVRYIQGDYLEPSDDVLAAGAASGQNPTEPAAKPSGKAPSDTVD